MYESETLREANQQNVEIQQQDYNQNFLDSFPIQIHQQFQTVFLNSIGQSKTSNEMELRIQKKISCILKFFLQKVKSKKEGYNIAKNLQFLNSCKGERSNKDIMKILMKLKMMKNSIQKQQIINICHGLALQVILGNSSQV